MEFKEFLINENVAYMGEKLGDILNALQELVTNGKAVGDRQLRKNCEQIVNQLRQMIRTKWQDKQKMFLPELQSIGVSIMKAIDDKDDLVSVLQDSASHIQDILSKLGTPINNL